MATEYAMGKLGELIPDGVCRTIPADAYVAWSIHLYPGGLGATAPNDVLEGNVVELGIWLQPEDYVYEYRQDLAPYPSPLLFQDGRRECPCRRRIGRHRRGSHGSTPKAGCNLRGCYGVHVGCGIATG